MSAQLCCFGFCTVVGFVRSKTKRKYLCVFKRFEVRLSFINEKGKMVLKNGTVCVPEHNESYFVRRRIRPYLRKYPSGSVKLLSLQ